MNGDDNKGGKFLTISSQQTRMKMCLRGIGRFELVGIKTYGWNAGYYDCQPG